MNSITAAMADLAVKHSLSETDVDSNSHMIAKPKPRKPGGDNNSSFNASPQQRRVTSSATNQDSNKNDQHHGPNQKSSTNLVLSSTNSASNDGSNILMRTFGNITMNSGTSLNGQALFNAVVANSSKSSAVPAANLKLNSAPSPSKLSPQKPVTYDHKKLGVLSQFVQAESSSVGQSNCLETRPNVTSTPNSKSVNRKLLL